MQFLLKILTFPSTRAIMLKKWDGYMKNAMIFGDSYSTFKDYIPEGYSVYYSSEETDKTDVRAVEETWWFPLCKELDLNLVRNDSWSGATVCYTGYQGDCSTTSSFIYRLERLHEEGFFQTHAVDTVFVFGGTNDDWCEAPIGEPMTEGIQREDLYCARPAIFYFAKRLKEILPSSKVLFIINTLLKPEIAKAFEMAAEHHGMFHLYLADIDKQNGHPTVRGMAQIREQVTAFLKKV